MDCVLCDYFLKDGLTLSDRVIFKHGESPSLMEHCFNLISQEPTLCIPSLLRDLPVTILDDLKFYLSADCLHSLSPFLEQSGVETSLVWKRLLYKSYGTRRRGFGWCDDCVKPRVGKWVFKVSKDRRNPHQVYMAELCPVLLQCMLENRSKDSVNEQILKGELVQESYLGLFCFQMCKNAYTVSGKFNPAVCRQCSIKISSYLDTVTSLVLSWNYLVSILTDDKLVVVFKSALFNLVDLEIFNITFKNVDAVLKCLRKLINGNTLKSLAFAYPTQRNDYSILSILEQLFTSNASGEKYVTDKSDGDKMEETTEDFSGADNEDLDLFDEALNSDGNQTYWINDTKELMNIRDRIKTWRFNCNSSQLVEGLQSLCFPLEKNIAKPDFGRRMSNLFSCLGTVKRLDLKDIGINDCTDVFVLLGCHHLTHLRLTFRGLQDAKITTMFAVLFENYRISHSSSCRPLEYLSLCDFMCSYSSQSPSLNHYDFDIYAVKRLHLMGCDFNPTDQQNFVHFLCHNKALTYLELSEVEFRETFVHMDLPPLLAILNAITNISSLETLILNGKGSDPNYGRLDDARLEEAVVNLLRVRPCLKHLVLTSCCLKGSFVSSPNFISAVTQHEGLEHLSLSENYLGVSGIKLLQALCDAQKLQVRNLKGLRLAECSIPGRPLLEAAKQICNDLQGKIFIRYLNLNHNAVTLKEMLSIQNLLSRCVEFLDLEGNRGESHVANFFEEEVT